MRNINECSWLIWWWWSYKEGLSFPFLVPPLHQIPESCTWYCWQTGAQYNYVPVTAISCWHYCSVTVPTVLPGCPALCTVTHRVLHSSSLVSHLTIPALELGGHLSFSLFHLFHSKWQTWALLTLCGSRVAFGKLPLASSLDASRGSARLKNNWHLLVTFPHFIYVATDLISLTDYSIKWTCRNLPGHGIWLSLLSVDLWPMFFLLQPPTLALLQPEGDSTFLPSVFLC